MPFTDEELYFLAHHLIAKDEVHDGRWQTKSRREWEAKEAGKAFILTSAPCRAQGHRLRTRAGHCIQCDPKKIAYIRRETQAGYVYIAGSLEGRVIKIGTTEDIDRRANRLIVESYGGFSDWRVLLCAWVSNAGRTEREILSRIPGERTAGVYFKDGQAQTAVEMIRCSFSSALDVFAAETLAIADLKAIKKQFEEYEFTQR
ncbi:GIY-YIG nuclease family protein [Bradyrhizobium liaoningense]|uniref:GIY-YIG nuclease family protein n=1 Tax=Bradyrhizobium liaoningense TaxID=43992 RepID=UPI001BAB0319|nr:GIY-YIG nuclease family protein [Bradyrhizobium liaoningense]MBR0705400.1 GIY-YIG nuclease family protein [Bradyrhizobium liaoningense]